MSFAFSCRALLGVCALVSATAWAQIRVADVAYSASTTVQGQTLQLNGAGVRHKAVFKVYTAGLYLGASARSGAEVVALPGPKRLRIVMGGLPRTVVRTHEGNCVLDVMVAVHSRPGAAEVRGARMSITTSSEAVGRPLTDGELRTEDK